MSCKLFEESIVYSAFDMDCMKGAFKFAIRCYWKFEIEVEASLGNNGSKKEKFS